MRDATFGSRTQQAAVHQSAVGLERFARDAAHLDDAVEKAVDLGLGDPGAGSEDDIMGGVDDLGLVPGMGLELFADRGIPDDEEPVGLESEGGRREDEGLLKGLPGLFGNLP